MLLVVTVIALVTQVPLAITLEVSLHASTASLGPSIYTVGLSEELAKAIPVLAVALIYRRSHGLTPRDYLFLGAVSGLVFGASEVVHYFTVNGIAEFYLTVQSAIPSIEQLISTGHSAPDALFAVLIGPVLYFILDFVLAVRHRSDHACLLVRPDRLFHRAGGDRTVQVVRRRLDRAGGRRDLARAERLGPGERPPAVDPGRPGQRHFVPRLREGRVPRRPGGSRRLAVGSQAARHAGRARSRSARRTARRNVGPASARDRGRSARAGRSARRPAGQTVVGALTADPVPLLTVHLLGMEDQAAEGENGTGHARDMGCQFVSARHDRFLRSQRYDEDCRGGRLVENIRPWAINAWPTTKATHGAMNPATPALLAGHSCRRARVLARSRLVAAVLTGTLGRSRVYRSWLARSVDPCRREPADLAVRRRRGSDRSL